MVDPHLLVRAAAVYLAASATAAVWAWRRPGRRVASGAALAFAWNVPALLVLHLAARRFGWWHFDAEGGLLLGMPVDVYLSWAWLWALPALAWPTMPLAGVTGLALVADIALMPIGEPVLRLGPTWLAGEAVALGVALIPGQLLARWTIRRERLHARVVLQIVAFSGLLLFVMPAVAIEGSGSAWVNPLDRPAWQVSLMLQAVFVPALVGLTAVQEFAVRGGGTPVPFDPPQRLVTSGVYAYVRNPMQLAAVLLLVLLGVLFRNAWVAAAALSAHVYSIGLAGWDEDEDLRQRFGTTWTVYRKGVRRWLPRWRPWIAPQSAPAHLYVSETCGMCREVGRWFRCREAVGLMIVPAESHPRGPLTRITYDPEDGTPASAGIAAIARALEHVHFGWAIAAFILRLPLVSTLAQLLADASGAGPRTIPHGSCTGR